MSEKLRSVKFEHFRGLPDNDIQLKGKNLVLLGSNGKGKSAVVDGIEFLFSGQVTRFVGAGTGTIDHDDAIRHVKMWGVPRVTLSLSPSNGTISRSLGSGALPVTSKAAAREYFDNHPGIDSFILRRSRILEFVCDQDADRYKKFIRLLGVKHIDSLQRTFVEAERQAIEATSRERLAHRTKLAMFSDPVAKFAPTNLEQVLAYISNAVTDLGLNGLSGWHEAQLRLSELKAMRPEANKEKIDALTRALVSLERPLPPDIGADITTCNTLRQKLILLGKSSADAPRSGVLAEAFDHLSNHPTETSCPVCERDFGRPIEEVLARLKQRGDTLRELRESVAARQASVKRVRLYGETVATQIAEDLRHSTLIDPATIKAFRSARAAILRWLRSGKWTEVGTATPDIVTPDLLTRITLIRSECTEALKAQKARLLPPNTSKLEAVIALVEKGIAAQSDIAIAEQAISSAENLSQRTTIAKSAFTKARESAIQTVFDEIAQTVMDYYRRLHDFDDGSERSECTALELTPSSRAAAGGLRLAIQFLGLADTKDPRAFLSEGHLDSLGLCLFLATVRIFNPPGSLLVLDDVLTSIDREHRRRVGELLFELFADYQILLTTHDEHWYNLLSSSARARGTQGRWAFVKLDSWSVETGPSLSEVDASWEFIEDHLTEAGYRGLGGPFRIVLEDFLMRVAAKLKLKVEFKIDGKYTSGDFVTAGIQDRLRDELIRLSPGDETKIRREVGRVFGQGDLVNFLSHNNPGRLEVTLDQAKDFSHGVLDLTRMCEEHQLIRGR